MEFVKVNFLNMGRQALLEKYCNRHHFISIVRNYYTQIKDFVKIITYFKKRLTYGQKEL